MDLAPAARAIALACLALVLPDGASAQERGACGQPAALTEALAGPLAEGFEPVRAFVEIRRSEPRYVEFALDGDQAVTLRTEAPQTDPVVTLFDAAGMLVTYDDDSGGGTEALISQALSAGRYCAQVRPAMPSPVEFAQAVLVIESGMSTAVMAQVPCGDPAKVVDLATGLSAPVATATFEGETDGETGRADFRVSLNEQLPLRIDAASPAFDTVLSVSDMNGNTITENDDFSGSDSRVEQVLDPGEYCVSVRSFGGDGGFFTLALAGSDLAPPPSPCGDPALTGLLSDGFGAASAPVSVAGQVDEGTGQGWFSLSVAEPLDLRIDATSNALDTVLELHDAGGTLLGENDDGPNGTDSRLELSVAPGDYCVTVRAFDGTAGPFGLSLAAAGAAMPLPGDQPPDPSMATGVEDMGVLETEVRSYTIGGDATLWASFSVAAPASVTVQGVSVSSDFAVALFAGDGTLIGESGPVPAMSSAEVSADLGPGTYLVALTNAQASGTLLRQITVSRN